MENLSEKAGKAGSFLLFRKIWGGFVNLFVMAYLARVLSPAEFGLVAVSNALITYLQVFASAGIGEFLIYYRGDNEAALQQAAFWLNGLLTGIVAVSLLIVAPLWAGLYGDTRISLLLGLLTISFVFSTLSGIPQALLRKELAYKQMVFAMSVVGTISQVSQVVLAYWGAGVYTLVIPSLFSAPILCILMFRMSGFKPSWAFIGTKYWKEIWMYSRHVMGGQFLTKLVNEGDNLIIGATLGTHFLGIYDIAFKLSNLFNQHLLPIIANISMPVFSRNTEKTGGQFIKMMSLISFVFFPVYGLLFVFADPVVHFLYGENWAAAVVPLQILIGFALFRSLSSPAGSFFVATGLARYSFYFTLVFAPIYLSAIYWGTHYGLIVTCLVVTGMRVSTSVIQLCKVQSLTQVRFAPFVASFSSALCCSIMASIACFWIGIGYWSIVVFLLLYVSLNRLIFPVQLRQQLQTFAAVIPSQTLSQFVRKISQY